MLTRLGSLIAVAVVILVHAAPANAQIALPELIYYKFNEGAGSTTANGAAPGVGANPANVIGHTLDSPGVFGSTGLNGAGTSGAHVDTGWITALGTSPWTISFWHSPVNSTTTTLSYAFGDSTAGSFRMFNHGVATPTGMMLRRTGMTDVNITGLSQTDPNHLAYVYDPVAGNITGYLNGVVNVTVAQAAQNINGTAPLWVGGYSGASVLRADYWMDEFQLFSRALSAADVVDAMNANFVPVPEPTSLVLVGLASAVSARWIRRRRVTA